MPAARTKAPTPAHEDPWRDYFRSMPRGNKPEHLCAPPGCNNRHVGTCTWQLSAFDGEGKRVLTGELCKVKLCEEHSTVVKGARLCPWHKLIATEQGLIK